MQFPVFLLSERRKTGKSTLLPMGAAVKLQLPVSSFQSGGKLENHFTADERGGKAAIASFPPLRAQEGWKIRFTADESGGKAATASFPPLLVEENWKMGVYRPCMQRQSGVSVRQKSQEPSIPN
ncbi:hypothetical protein AAC387_Pa07g2637 [Persea americana]